MSSNRRHAGHRKYLLITLLAFLLACTPSLLNRSVWTDEIYTMLVLSGQMLTGFPETVTTPESIQQFLHSSATVRQIFHTLVQDDVHPPVYFFAAHAWTSVFGQALISLRWLSVAAGLVSIFVFFRFLEQNSPALARITIPIFAFSAGVLHYSTEARHYIFSLLGLVVTLYVMGRIIAARDDHRGTNVWLVAALIAATSLTVLTNYLAIFPVAACYLWFIALQSNWRAGMIGALCSVAVFSLWLPFLFQHRPEIAAHANGFDALSQELYSFDYHAGEVGWRGLPRQLYLVMQGTFGSLFIASNAAYPTVLHWIGRLFLAGLVVIGAATAIARREKSDASPLAWLFIFLSLAPAVGAMTLYIVVAKQMYGLRYMMLAAPGLAALCGMGILSLYRHNSRVGLFAWGTGLALLLSIANWGYTSSYYQGKTIYRDLAASLQRLPAGSSLVIAGTGPMPGNTTALFHELPADTNVLVLRKDSDIASVLAIAERYDHVWLIRVRELTVAVEDKLAESLKRSWEKKAVLEQIEHYEKPALAQTSAP